MEIAIDVSGGTLSAIYSINTVIPTLEGRGVEVHFETDSKPSTGVSQYNSRPNLDRGRFGCQCKRLRQLPRSRQ